LDISSPSEFRSDVLFFFSKNLVSELANLLTLLVLHCIMIQNGHDCNPGPGLHVEQVKSWDNLYGLWLGGIKKIEDCELIQFLMNFLQESLQ